MADQAEEQGVDTKTYYEQHADKEREYVRVYSAVPVDKGDTWVERGVFSVQHGVKGPGYKIKAYGGMQDCSESILDKDEFAAKAEDASKLYPSMPKEELDADDLASMKPIKKGTDYVAGGFIGAEAECDGFLFKTKKGDVFLSNYSVSTAFNYAGKKFETDGAQIVRMKDEPNIKGIILDEDVTFAFKSGPYKAEKGSFVMPNPEDEDGFTAYPPGFATYGLRRNQSDEALAAIADVRTDEEIKVRGPLHFKK